MTRPRRFRSLRYRHGRPAPSKPRTDGRTTERAGAVRRKPVLVVEDSATFGGLLVALLRQEGYQAMRACSLSEAANIARDRRPEAVLVDLSLPYPERVELVEEILQAESISGKPLLVVTTHPVPFLKEQAGVSEVVSKPYDVDKLLNCVRRALGEPEVEVPEKQYDLQDSNLHAW